MIKFYEFPSTNTLIVLDTERQITAPFSLRRVKNEHTDFKTWWGNDSIDDYVTCNLEEILDELTDLHD